MGKKLLVVVLLVLVAGGVAAYVAMRSALPEFGPAPANRDLVPKGVAFYAEAKDLRTLWKQAETTQSWKDFVASKALAKAREVPSVKSLLAGIDELSTGIKYPLSGDNVMKFLGRETSLAARPTDAGLEYALLAKIDVDALTADLVQGKADWRALQAELNKRTGDAKFQVTTEEIETKRGKLTLAHLVREDVSGYMTLCGDTLVIATEKPLCMDVIGIYAGTRGDALGSDPRFQADLAALPPETAVATWFDLDVIAAKRAAVDGQLKTWGVEPEAVAAADAVVDGTKGAGSCALAAVVPGADLYRIHFKFSKDAELFADRAEPRMADVFAGDWLFYAEGRDLGRAAAAYERSKLRTKLAATELGRTFDAFFTDPSAESGVVKFLSRSALSGASRVRAARPGGKPLDEPADVTSEWLDRFTVNLGWHLLGDQIDALLHGDIAVALEWAGNEDELPRLGFALRLDTEGRLVALAQFGLADARKAGVEKTSYKGHDIRSKQPDRPKTPGAHVALLGDLLVVGTDIDFVKAAIDATSPGGAPAPSARRAEALASFKDGWWGFAHLDYDRGLKAIEKFTDASPMGERFRPMVALLKNLGIQSAHVGMACYVADDFSSIELRARMWRTDPDAPTGSLPTADREPTWRKSLPDSTMMYAGSMQGISQIWEGFKLGVGIAGGDLAEVEQGFREATEVDLEKEFIPAFGEELLFALTYAPAKPFGPPAGAPRGGVPEKLGIPGLVVGFGVKDEATMRKVAEKGFAILTEASRGEMPPDSGELVTSETREGVTLWLVNLPENVKAMVPVSPAVALGEGWIVISSEADVARRMIDARHGKAPSIESTPVFARAAERLGKTTVGEFLLDWNKLLDEIRENSDALGGAVPTADDVPFPEFPDNGDEAEWRRRLAKFNEDRAASQKKGGEKIRQWIDSFRVIDHLVSGSHVDGKSMESVFAIRFSD